MDRPRANGRKTEAPLRVVETRHCEGCDADFRHRPTCRSSNWFRNYFIRLERDRWFPDSPLEEAVMSEPVSDGQIPGIYREFRALNVYQLAESAAEPEPDK